MRDWTGKLNGYSGPVHTPNLDRLMDLGTTFTQAYAQSTLCNPSRTSVISGQLPSTTQVFSNHEQWDAFVDPSQTIFAQFREAGYTLGGAGKLFHDTQPQEVTNLLFDHWWTDPGGKYPQGFPLGLGVFDGPAEEMWDHYVADWAIDFLNDQENAEDPFFLAFGFTNPHVPLVVPQEFYDLYPIEDVRTSLGPVDDLDDLPASARRLLNTAFLDRVLAQDKLAEFTQGYLAAISFMDAEIGRVLAAVEEQGRLADTSIVVWSDHGLHMGEKQHLSKQTLWEESARVPLIVIDPDLGVPGQTVATPVSILDIYPTLLDLTDVTADVALEGRSLAPLLADPTTPWDAPVYTTIQGHWAVRAEGHLYIRYRDGAEELYDLARDPDQLVNLAVAPSPPAIVEDLRQTMQGFFEEKNIIYGTKQPETIRGTDGDDLIYGNRGAAETVIGGPGDDYYDEVVATTTVIEAAGEGYDTVVQRLPSYAVPAHIERVVASGPGSERRDINGNAAAEMLVGHNGNNTIDGGGGDDQIYGAGRNDELRGGEGADRLDGGVGGDVLDGGAGDDVLSGGGGRDRLVGGAGRDIFRDTRNGLDGDVVVDFELDETINVTTDSLSAADLDYDALTGSLRIGELELTIENRPMGVFTPRPSAVAGTDLVFAGGDRVITGTDGDDRLEGGAANELLMGGPGDDRLVGGGGRDVFDGGAGNDTLDLSRSALELRVDLEAGIVDYGRRYGTEAVVAVENVIGGRGDDAITGDDGGNVIAGEAGNDTLSGGSGDDWLIGGGGRDVFDGGEGSDTVDLSASMFGSRIDLEAGVIDYGGRYGTETLIAIENVIGGGGDDTITGGGGGNVIAGEAGNDTLSGGSGDDWLIGGGGRDVFDGGEGSDTVDLSASMFGSRIDLEAGVIDYGGRYGTETLIAVENVIGGGGGDVFTGNAAANRFSGGEGSDRWRVVEPAAALDLFADFDPDEDVIELAGVVAGGAVAVTAATVTDFVRIITSDGRQVLQVDTDGSAVTQDFASLLTLPSAVAGTDLHLGDNLVVTDGARGSVLHAINAGGAAVADFVDTPDGRAVDLRADDGGFVVAGGEQVSVRDGLGGAASVLGTQRWDPQAGADMIWQLPVAADTEVVVDLYFAETYSPFRDGGRSFDVRIEGELMLDAFDVAVEEGYRLLSPRSFGTTVGSDGLLDIEFARDSGAAPLINAVVVYETDLFGI